MKTNCFCKEKNEEWSFDRQLSCWYAVRECTACNYYWEGPDHSKTAISVHPSTGKIVRNDNDSTEIVESIREKEGAFRVYCYDENGLYGKPVQFDLVNDIFHFCELNKHSHSQIKVITSSDEICIQTISGNYVFPEEWHKYNT